MAGRRWKAAVADELDKLGIISKNSGWMVLGGPANSYTHYIATPEEYGIQRYEGASTLYGQFTYVFYTFLVPFFSSSIFFFPIRFAICLFLLDQVANFGMF